MYDICHPIYYNMSQLGCSDQVKLTTAFYVYVELCEVKRYWDVDYKYCDTLQLFYLQARKTKKSENKDIFIPWPAMSTITLDFISEIKNVLDVERFTFVFKEGDTTSVYYSISAGIHKPKSPEDSQDLKKKNEKKFELEREINRNTSNLYERALLVHDGENENITDLSSSSLKKEESELKYFTAMDVTDSTQEIEFSEIEKLSDQKKIDLTKENDNSEISQKSSSNDLSKNGSDFNPEHCSNSSNLDESKEN